VALHLCAAAVLFVHNYPSGEPSPSQEDQEITRRLKETGEMLGIRMLDHVVLGDGRFSSFSDRGLM
jgi:DNA repair protein RadC